MKRRFDAHKPPARAPRPSIVNFRFDQVVECASATEDDAEAMRDWLHQEGIAFEESGEPRHPIATISIQQLTLAFLGHPPPPLVFAFRKKEQAALFKLFWC